MELYTIIRTSKDTAEGEDIVLRETSTTRLVFKPLLVNNAQDSSAPIKGTFVFQHKRSSRDWEEHNEVPLSSLKGDEWIKLDLKADEIHKLAKKLVALYRVYKRTGLPKGKTYFIQVDLSESDSPSLMQEDLAKLLEVSRSTGSEIFSGLVNWATQSSNSSEVLEQLDRLEVNTLQRLNSLVGLSTLKNVLQLWEDNKDNCDEEFWQKTLEKNAFVISQIFAFPVVVIKEKAYVGGKVISNSGGHIADFLASNHLTKNAVIVEIKTPCTKLLGRKYRDGIFSVSEELSGSINQVLNYRYSLTTDFLSVARGYEGNLDVFNPQCLVIAGNGYAELTSEDHKKSFEMTRCNYKDVVVITWDELFEKTKQLIKAIEGAS